MKASVKIDRAYTKYEDGKFVLCLEIPMESRQVARGIERVIRETKRQFCAVFQEFKARRSLDANAYYWVLVGKLAEAIDSTPEEIYRHHVRDLGIYDTLCMETKAVRAFAKHWKSGHTGRRIETRVSKLDGCTTVLAYYGSSDFDTKQMSRLIDNCIQDCKSVGIETATPQELQRLKEGWK